MAVTSFAIRTLTKADSGAVLTLARSLEDWFNEEGLKHMEQDLESHGGFVATSGDRVVGFVTFRPIDRVSADLSWLGVAREYHRMGLGRSLLQRLVDRLRGDGFNALEVSTVADSLDYEPYARTRAFYRALGFQDLHIDRGFFFDGNERYDRLVMKLDLPGEGPA